MLSACITRVGAQMKRCYLEHGATCPPGEARTAAVLAAVDARIRARCPDAATVQAIGYGASATPATVSARVQEACTGEVASIGARTFGGPQGALLPGADAPTIKCLSRASTGALRLLGREANLRATCIASAHGLGEPCDVGRTNANIATVESTASAMIGAWCPNLKATTGLDAATWCAGGCAGPVRHGGGARQPGHFARLWSARRRAGPAP
jgi:hypothetical protein